jgi:hypothetical protein
VSLHVNLDSLSLNCILSSHGLENNKIEIVPSSGSTSCSRLPCMLTRSVVRTSWVYFRGNFCRLYSKKLYRWYASLYIFDCLTRYVSIYAYILPPCSVPSCTDNTLVGFGYRKKITMAACSSSLLLLLLTQAENVVQLVADIIPLRLVSLSLNFVYRSLAGECF